MPALNINIKWSQKQDDPYQRLLTLPVIIGILLVFARMLGLKQNVCCVKSPLTGLPFSNSNFKDIKKTSIIEISEVRVQLPELQVTLHLYV